MDNMDIYIERKNKDAMFYEDITDKLKLKAFCNLVLNS
jgi:hypothetical protein